MTAPDRSSRTIINPGAPPFVDSPTWAELGFTRPDGGVPAEPGDPPGVASPEFLRVQDELLQEARERAERLRRPWNAGPANDRAFRARTWGVFLVLLPTLVFCAVLFGALCWWLP